MDTGRLGKAGFRNCALEMTDAPRGNVCWQFQIKRGGEFGIRDMKLVVINKEVTFKAIRLMCRAMESK